MTNFVLNYPPSFIQLNHRFSLGIIPHPIRLKTLLVRRIDLPSRFISLFFVDTSNCIITIEQRSDATRITGEPMIDLKILGRSPEKAQKLIKEFEEQNYSTRKIHHEDIHLFLDEDVSQRMIRSSSSLIFLSRSNNWNINVVHRMFFLRLIKRTI